MVMAKHKTVGKEFVTGQTAGVILQGLLPASEWLVRQQNPDFHIDYVIEMVEGGEPSGINFAVQLKGTQRKPGKAGNLTVRLKAKHLRYFRDHRTLPVFLILVDVREKKAYWCFTQQFAREKVPANTLDGNGKVTVPFTPAASLEDIVRFKAAVRSATAYMRELYPGSPDAAIKAELARMQALDPRMGVKFAYADDRQNIELTSKEHFQFKAQISGQNTPEFRQALVDFVEKGAELKLDSSQLRFDGVPLFTEFLSGGGELSLKYGHDVPCALQVFDAEEDEQFLFQMDGAFRTGTAYATFNGTLPSSALSLHNAIGIQSYLKGETQNLKVSFHADAWTGQPVQHMAYFNPIRRFFESIRHKKRVRLKYVWCGNELFGGEFRGLEEKGISEICQIMELLDKARFVFKQLQLNPVLPKLGSVVDREWSNIDEAFELLNDREIKRLAPDFEIAFTTWNPLSKANLALAAEPLEFVCLINCIFSGRSVIFRMSTKSSQVPESQA
jgi:Domain of unknown function (DUF4365)